ncbi:hypothetical protein M758_6G056500 [Ceratodon purpureus]|uniref:Uncharacterized protein n=1 Tax=Ceratodon purpureus TaxID=3225 RepID=A0A8T0J736_CERPU|nr:hypothetical protein KC19_7G031600 [Ceratodon purpureus]KAG0590653.1 hypothetical protein KC19_1G116900 [Ceratodon purpureus]KAG0612843.1 hypothetical protein M758_6G056500 [Ceratodon purpureus]
MPASGRSHGSQQRFHHSCLESKAVLSSTCGKTNYYSLLCLQNTRNTQSANVIRTLSKLQLIGRVFSLQPGFLESQNIFCFSCCPFSMPAKTFVSCKSQLLQNNENPQHFWQTCGLK